MRYLDNPNADTSKNVAAMRFGFGNWAGDVRNRNRVVAPKSSCAATTAGPATCHAVFDLEHSHAIVGCG